jgi:hypothetical protein
MNSSSRFIVILFMCLVPFAQGQDCKSGPVGFVRMLNAVAMGAGKLEFMLDGKAVRPAGYQLGNVTGGIALKPADYKVVFRREGVKEGETQVQVKVGDTTILIPFAEEIPATENQPARWQIRILKLKQHESEDKPTASFGFKRAGAQGGAPAGGWEMGACLCEAARDRPGGNPTIARLSFRALPGA